MTNSIEDVCEQAQVILLVGSNPEEAHPVMGMRIRQAVERGAKLIVVDPRDIGPGSYTHLRAHETVLDLVCRLLLEKKNIIFCHFTLNLNTHFLLTVLGYTIPTVHICISNHMRFNTSYKLEFKN